MIDERSDSIFLNNLIKKFNLFTENTEDTKMYTENTTDTDYYTFEYNDENKPNVMIKYFIIIINDIVNKITSSNIPTDAYKTILFFIYKYVNFIVKQGSSIVTNLEHLKFFFLSNTDNIKTYNTNNENKAFKCDTPDNCESLTNLPKTYKIKTKVSENSFMDETVNMGNMDNYRLLAILQELSNKNSIITDFATKRQYTFIIRTQSCSAR